MGEVFTKYVFDTTEASASLSRFKQEVRELQGAEQSSQKTFQTNAQKRAQLLKEEQQDLIELRRRRDAAYAPEQIALYNKRIAETERRVKGLKGEYSDLEKRNRSLVSSFRKIGAAIGIAFGVREILRFTKHAAELSAEAEGVRNAFQRVGGTQAVMQDLQRATRGTVTELQLMNRTVQASNFNIPIEQMAELFKFATNRAIELGEPVDKFVDRIIDGIGRKSIRVLDDLGFSLAELQEEMKTTGDFAAAAANMISRELEEMGDVADTNAVKIARSQTALNDATVKFGDTVAPVYAGFLDLLRKALLGVNALVTGMSRVEEEDFAAAQERINFEMEGYRKAVFDADNAQGFFIDRLAKIQEILRQEVTDVANIIEKFDQYKDQLDKTNPVVRIFAELVERARKALEKEEDQLTGSEAAYARRLQANIDAAKAVKEKSEINRIELQLLTEYQRAQIASIPVWERQLSLLRAGKLAGEDQVGIGRTIADIQEDIKNAQERLNKEVGVGTAEYYQARAALDALNQELERWTKNTEKQITLLEELELDKIGGVDEIADQLDMVQDIISTMSTEEAAEHIKGLIAEFENVEGMERFVEGLEKMFLTLHDAPDALEGLEGFTAFIDGLDSEAEKIMALRSAIAGLGEDSPALKAALEGQLEALLTSTDQQKEELLDSFVRTEEEIAMQSLDIAMQLAENLLKIGAITQEQYEAIIDGVKEKMAEIGTATEGTFASTLGGLAQLSGAFKDVFNTMAKDAEKNAQFLNALTLFTILLNQAEALSKAIASAKGVTAVDYIVQIGIAVAAVVGAIAKAKAIQNQAKAPTAPRFGGGGEIHGMPHTQGGVPINAEKGEYMIKSSAYAKAKEAVHAINSERFDTYVTKHYIEPLLKSKQLAREDHDRGFARNIAESLHLDGKAEHYLRQIARRGNGARIENWDELARLIKKDGRGSTY